MNVNQSDGTLTVNVLGVDYVLTKADLNAKGKTTIATVEAYLKDEWFPQILPQGQFGAVHVVALSPLSWIVRVSNDPISGSWWL
jgi:hypothetical protein